MQGIIFRTKEQPGKIIKVCTRGGLIHRSNRIIKRQRNEEDKIQGGKTVGNQYQDNVNRNSILSNDTSTLDESAYLNHMSQYESRLQNEFLH